MVRILGVAVKAAILSVVLKVISSGLVPLGGAIGQAQHYMASPDPVAPLVLLVAYSASLITKTAFLLGEVLQKVAVVMGLIAVGVFGLRSVDYLFASDHPPRSRRNNK
jgi:zinc transporter ZupT